MVRCAHLLSLPLAAFTLALTLPAAATPHTHIGAYLMNADGQLSLIVKDGMTMAQGDAITVDSMILPSYGEGIAVNNKGQIALPLKIGSRPGMIALLTSTGQ
jgi:hypothetical protein